MNKTIHVTLLLLSFLCISSTYAEEIKTFRLKSAGGIITVTQDVPPYFLGVYESISPDLQLGKMLLKKGRETVSYQEGDKTKGKLFTWGVIVKNGKIEKQKVIPPNPAYKPYERMKLIIRYEDEKMDLVAWGLYRAESEKYGPRIVAGRYLKTKAK